MPSRACRAAPMRRRLSLCSRVQNRMRSIIAYTKIGGMIGAGSEGADGAVEERGMRPNGDIPWPRCYPIRGLWVHGYAPMAGLGDDTMAAAEHRRRGSVDHGEGMSSLGTFSAALCRCGDCPSRHGV